MRQMFDFKCDDCGTVEERYIDAGCRITECRECGGKSKRQISMPTVRLEGVTGDFPGAYSKWARIREDNARIKAKRNS